MRGALWDERSHYFGAAIELLVKAAINVTKGMIPRLPNFRRRFNTSPGCANLFLRVVWLEHALA